MARMELSTAVVHAAPAGCMYGTALSTAGSMVTLMLMLMLTLLLMLLLMLMLMSYACTM